MTDLVNIGRTVGMGTLAQLGGCPVLMRPDLGVAETTRFAGALEGAIGKADGLSSIAVISDQCTSEVVDVRRVGRLRREDGEGMANADEIRIIIGDTGHSNGVAQSEVANVAECHGSAGG